jgi:hypothetical protein
MMGKSRLFRRIIALAKRLGGLSDDLVGAKGDLAQIAEDYETERRLCLRCGTPLDAELRCSVCYKRDHLGRGDVEEGDR